MKKGKESPKKDPKNVEDQNSSVSPEEISRREFLGKASKVLGAGVLAHFALLGKANGAEVSANYACYKRHSCAAPPEDRETCVGPATQGNLDRGTCQTGEMGGDKCEPSAKNKCDYNKDRCNDESTVNCSRNDDKCSRTIEGAYDTCGGSLEHSNICVALPRDACTGGKDKCRSSTNNCATTVDQCAPTGEADSCPKIYDKRDDRCPNGDHE